MNRAERRQQARQHGWKGSKSGRGVSFTEAIRKALDEQERLEREAALVEEQASIAKIQKAALATRDMGLVIPGL